MMRRATLWGLLAPLTLAAPIWAQGFEPRRAARGR